MGKSQPKNSPSRTGAVHPHACGEKFSETLQRVLKDGSSPRVWGKGGRGQRACARVRFIPTRVGKRAPSAPRAATSPVHPHACGEKGHAQALQKAEHGSSPRVWGKAYTRSRQGSIRRFIPTRVGKSTPHPCPSPPSPVHPHACGEKENARNGMTLKTGSSPRVWGKGRRVSRCSAHARFIPTRVGKRAPARLAASPTAVHPHACGEKHLTHGDGYKDGGSSPRVWGKALRHRPNIPRTRFIPTRVGKSRIGMSSLAVAPVHPHACGEKFSVSTCRKV